ncbi:MAG: RodZ domain-containing protein [Bdellovibrionia bacterium]
MTQNEVSLGEYLRHERELRGITIEQVASATKVGVRSLHALEADHYSELPAKPFVRGFVNAYCQFIGLDSKEVLARYEDYIQQKSSERPNHEGGHSGYAFEKRDGDQQSRTFLTLAIVGFTVVGAVAMMILKPSLHHHKSSHLDRLRAAHPSQPAAAVGLKAEAPLVEPTAMPSPAASVVTTTLVSGNSEVGGQSPALTLVSDLKPSSPSSAALSLISAEVPAQPKVVEAPGVRAASLPLPVSTPLVLLSPPVVSPSPVPSPVASSSPHAADPLDSGLPLLPSEIHHKVIVKVLADIWVRYRVDARPIRKFIIRKGNTLVLRAKDDMVFQVSNANAVKVNYNNSGLKLMKEKKGVAQVLGTPTLFYPAELEQKMPQPFGEVDPLPQTNDPEPESQTTPQSSP